MTLFMKTRDANLQLQQLAQQFKLKYQSYIKGDKN